MSGKDREQKQLTLHYCCCRNSFVSEPLTVHLHPRKEQLILAWQSGETYRTLLFQIYFWLLPQIAHTQIQTIIHRSEQATSWYKSPLEKLV